MVGLREVYLSCKKTSIIDPNVKNSSFSSIERVPKEPTPKLDKEPFSFSISIDFNDIIFYSINCSLCSI